MSRTAWIVQTNFEKQSKSPGALRSACEIDDRPFHEISVTPGSPTLPEMPAIDGPVVVHGRTTLILRAFEHSRWRRAVFFDPERFHHRAYAAAYGDDLVNADATILCMRDFIQSSRDSNERLFLKPNDDLKAFTGGVLTFVEARRLCERLLTARRPLDPTTEIVIGSPREIDAEWRMFFVEGRVVSGSMYHPSGDAYVPPDAIHFAESAAARWTPASVFVMDVARVDGAWKIVECNCFSGSGFYEADVLRIVRAVSSFQEASW